MIERTLFTADHEAFRDSFRRFIDKEIAPFHEAWEEQGYVDRAVWNKAGENGFLCATMPEVYGGSDTDFIDGGAEHQAYDELRGLFEIRAHSSDQLISTLSGGNQQKVVVGKNLLTEPHVLLLDEPTRGIDIKARRELFEVLDRLAKAGLTILFASSDLKEILGGADRVLVMCQGRITANLPRQELSEASLVAYSQVLRKDPAGTPTQNNKEIA